MHGLPQICVPPTSGVLTGFFRLRVQDLYQLLSWQGTYVIRPSCLAMHLHQQGLLDTFRVRHPSLKAFTHYSWSGSASRLDSIWWLPSPNHELQVLNAAILWNWDRRADHDPVIADLNLQLPMVAPAERAQTPCWRQLVRRLDQDLPEHVAAHAASHAKALRL